MNETPAQNPAPLPSWAKRLWLILAGTVAIDVIFVITIWIYGVAAAFESHISVIWIFLIFLMVTFLSLASAVVFSIVEVIEKSKLIQDIVSSFFEVLARLLTLDKIKQALKAIIFAYPALFAFSIVYEAIYFHSLDFPIIVIPVSLVDLFQVFTFWLPHILACVIMAYAILPIIVLSFEEALIPHSVRDRPRASVMLQIFLTGAISVSLAIFCYFFFWFFDISLQEAYSHINPLSFIVFSCFFIAIAAYSNYRMFSVKDASQRAEQWDSPDRNSRSTQLVWAHTVWFIFLLFFLCNIAFLYAKSSTMCKERNMYTFNFINGKSENLHLVRNFENYFLISDCKNKSLKFLNPDVVSSIIKHQQKQLEKQ